MYSEDLHHQLHTKMNTSGERSSPRGPQHEEWLQQSLSPRIPRGSRSSSPATSPRKPSGGRHWSPDSSPHSPRRTTNISQYSTVAEVRDWLEVKGFTRRCMDLLNGYTGIEVFGLQKHELERLLGHNEGRHLDSLLTVQKSNAGFRTRGASELRAILQRRKEQVDTNDSAEDGFGARPSFMPDTPDYSPPESEASSDDFGDAGKTLRNLLERQRKKIQQGGYRGPYQ